MWRRRPELNRGNRFCRPVPNHSATSPKSIGCDEPGRLLEDGEPAQERKTGFEPATSTLARLRSSQLSYFRRMIKSSR
jgi:hypothetical protein